jgi:hypothetical protein
LLNLEEYFDRLVCVMDFAVGEVFVDLQAVLAQAALEEEIQAWPLAKLKKREGSMSRPIENVRKNLSRVIQEPTDPLKGAKVNTKRGCAYVCVGQKGRRDHHQNRR